MVNQRHIPVVTVDRKIACGQIAHHVGSDNYKGGEIAGETMVRLLGGHGNIVELEGIPGTSATQERGAGFNHIVAQYPDIKIVARESANFDRLMAKESIRRLLRQNINFDGLFAHNDYMILGAMDALEEEKTKPKITIGFDGIAEAVEKIQDGRLTATIAQRPMEMGRVAVKKAVEILRGHQVPTTTLVELELKEKSIK